MEFPIEATIAILLTALLDGSLGKDCKVTEQGSEYVGTHSHTASGKPCQAWSKQYPNEHRFTSDKDYPDKTITAAQNFCRNPDERWYPGPWCYINRRGADPEWEECGLERCAKINTQGGPVAEGSTCTFPFKFKGDIYHYCITRNNGGHPWCSTIYDFDSDVTKWGNCIVHGAWSSWSEWTEECSRLKSEMMCRKTRNRRCNDPSPVLGGRACVGKTFEEINCKWVECSKEALIIFVCVGCVVGIGMLIAIGICIYRARRAWLFKQGQTTTSNNTQRQEGQRQGPEPVNLPLLPSAPPINQEGPPPYHHSDPQNGHKSENEAGDLSKLDLAADNTHIPSSITIETAPGVDVRVPPFIHPDALLHGAGPNYNAISPNTHLLATSLHQPPSYSDIYKPEHNQEPKS
ncbi:unnamed protein product [Owenia fusiformis]|uniref:Uncharacterized protein n=1 Tax=Owenia fusiformis TaxID=6347 RepID=A0A8J1TB62_OWEFU|nr:unnamed protein product [Owenia fusiformis]